MGDSPPDNDTANATASDQVPFASVLYELNKGKTHVQLGNELRDVVAAVRETGKAGSLTLRLDIKSINGEEGVMISARVGSKAPVFDSPASMFFVDDDNNLSRTPKHQPSMFTEADLS